MPPPVVTDVLMKKYVDAMPCIGRNRCETHGCELKRHDGELGYPGGGAICAPSESGFRRELPTQSTIHADEMVMQVHKEKGQA